MSLHIITGLPRNGKSYYCCTRILDDLEKTERCVYTNLPINPDIIARFVALRKKTRSIEYVDLVESILSRIRIFRQFNSRQELQEWRRKNPLWCRLDLNRRRCIDFDPSGRFVFNPGRSERLLYNMEQLVEYWNYSRANSVFYFDECYQIWNCMDASNRSADNKEKRKELQNYMRMHGHDADDIFLISHKERDLDRFILDTCSYRINVRNSKYWPIVPQEIIDKYWWLSFLGSLRWPFQFFMLRTYIGDEAQHHKSFYVSCRRHFFKCYDSMSRPNGLRDRGFDSKSAKSSDFRRGWFFEFKEWFFDALPALVILFLFVLFVRGFYLGIRSMLNKSHVPTQISKIEPEKTNVSSKSASTVTTETVKETPPVKIINVKAVTPSSLYYENGYVLRKGAYHEYQGKSFLVDFVERDFVTFLVDGKRYKVRSNAIF